MSTICNKVVRFHKGRKTKESFSRSEAVKQVVEGIILCTENAKRIQSKLDDIFVHLKNKERRLDRNMLHSLGEDNICSD